ncbi:hypothetical protein B0J11DRAFT_591330 [Dendryphion nanum]|uniref:DNA (cytosine-5-)-methyltransferase n=1 Tax=Dendryphion nanum TaxID=256645 RepID=A0A9P9DH22_9PLEO|nr:hypothetical protein B0J11DRAFT_591330 [Dendryphion nanum]
MNDSSKVEIRPVPRDFSQSSASNWIPPWPITTEVESLKSFKNEYTRIQSNDADPHTNSPLNIMLSSFEIFRAPTSKRNAYGYTPLHLFDVKDKNLVFSGVLTFQSVSYYVTEVDIDDYCIEGYGNEHSPSTEVYIRSKLCSKDQQFDIWYLLRRPKPEYTRFHEPFAWIADFGKHVIDFLSSHEKAEVGLSDFRSRFYPWLFSRFPGNRKFNAWHDAFGRNTDFRVAINAYIDYLYNQSYHLDAKLLDHPIWAQCLKGDKRVITEQKMECEKTVATPLIYDCFKHFNFGKMLQKIQPEPSVKAQQEERKRLLKFPEDNSYHFVPGQPTRHPILEHRQIRIGDVVGVRPSNDEKRGWKDVPDEDWLAYVQDILHKDGHDLLRILWVYRPSDTTIHSALYPVSRELFLSDNCNCGEEFLSTEAIRLYTIDWHPESLDTKKDFLIRSKYVTQESSFVTLKTSDLRCQCHGERKAPSAYRRGDCVYITRTKEGKEILEPVIITSNQQQQQGDLVTVRRLLRLKRDCRHLTKRHPHTMAQNELVWTDEHFTVSSRRIVRRCHIRYFPLEDVLASKVPFPYNCNGNGDAWIMSSELTISEGKEYLRPLQLQLRPFTQGFDLTKPTKPMPGLSMFSGGGNLDRALEEGGAVRFTHVIDISETAVHTQLANAHNPKEINVFWGPIDVCLKIILAGHNVKEVARIGDIMFIAAGSPCPGFSSLQPDPNSIQSLRNVSHITSFLSAVDIYVPERALLENVVSMTNKRKGAEDSVFFQLVACLVAMGYQVQQFIMDAWCFSSAQHRSRIFISITAPGLEPMHKPWHTHSHPPTINGRSLGILSNGERFGDREDYPCPFDFVTAGESTAGLPDIGTGSLQTCIPFPDHRLVLLMNQKSRAVMERIPLFPPGTGYVQAVKLGLMPKALQSNRKGKAFRRIKENGQFPTITTGISPHDAFIGQAVHWSQPSPMTVMMARKAQGVPDDEVIIGNPTEQWRIIGNGVDRHPGRALGLYLRWALEQGQLRYPQDSKRHIQSIHVEKEMPIQRPMQQDKIQNVDHRIEVDQAVTVARKQNKTTVQLKSSIVISTSSAILKSRSSTPSSTTLKRSLDDHSPATRNVNMTEGSKRTRRSGQGDLVIPSKWNIAPERLLSRQTSDSNRGLSTRLKESIPVTEETEENEQNHS